MHYTGQVYRPPVEWNTPLLEITIGCSHNKCAFCTMYRRTPFRVSPLEDIESDLQEMLAEYGSDLKRIYLLNGDPFVLSTKKLLEISDLIHRYFPKMETMSCYSSINDVRNKSLDELKTLRQAGYDELYFGLETGYDPGALFKSYLLQKIHGCGGIRTFGKGQGGGHEICGAADARCRRTWEWRSQCACHRQITEHHKAILRTDIHYFGGR